MHCYKNLKIYYFSFCIFEKLNIMSRLVLEFTDEQDLNLLIALANKLNAKVVEVSKDEKSSSVYWLEQIAENGGIQSIKNPSEWQRNIRIDNKLPNREL
jgi:hypothetical protein